MSRHEITTIPSNLRPLFKKMEFIGRIQSGQKPCFTTMTYVDSESWIGAGKRWKSGESRQTNCDEIEKVVDESIKALRNYENTWIYSEIMTRLIGMRSGIIRLRESSWNKPSFLGSNVDVTSDLNTFITNIERQFPDDIKIREGIITTVFNLPPKDESVYLPKKPTVEPQEEVSVQTEEKEESSELHTIFESSEMAIPSSVETIVGDRKISDVSTTTPFGTPSENFTESQEKKKKKK